MPKKTVKVKKKNDGDETRDVLGETWYQPSDPVGYTGVEKLRNATKKTKKETQQWLSNQLAYSLNKPIRRRFPTRKYRTFGLDDLWQMDLMEMIPYSKINSGYKYILNCIDVFSRFARSLPLKTKSGIEVATALVGMMKNISPRHVQTDEGKEFYNINVSALFKKKGIKHYSVFSQFKAPLAERFNRTLRAKIARHFIATSKKHWVSVLPSLISSYNNSIHRGINMTPASVNANNEGSLWIKQNNDIKTGVIKYKVGDNVRISRITNSPFIKNFDNNWSDEIFTISSVDSKYNVTMYGIKDYENDMLKGRFYSQELQVIDNPSVYRIHSILRTEGTGKNKRYFVKWHGYAKPGYVMASDLI
jgi:hypothetical protein